MTYTSSDALHCHRSSINHRTANASKSGQQCYRASTFPLVLVSKPHWCLCITRMVTAMQEAAAALTSRCPPWGWPRAPRWVGEPGPSWVARGAASPFSASLRSYLLVSKPALRPTPACGVASSGWQSVFLKSHLQVCDVFTLCCYKIH